MNIFQSITEGGQLTTHSLRMFKQVTKTSFFIAFLLWIFIFAYQMRDFNADSFQNLCYYEQSRLYQALGMKTMPVSQHFLTHSNSKNTIEIPVASMMQKTKPHADRIYQDVMTQLKKSAIF